MQELSGSALDKLNLKEPLTVKAGATLGLPSSRRSRTKSGRSSRASARAPLAASRALDGDLHPATLRAVGQEPVELGELLGPLDDCVPLAAELDDAPYSGKASRDISFWS